MALDRTRSMPERGKEGTRQAGGELIMATREAATSSPRSSEEKETQASVPGRPGVHLGMPTGTAGRVLWWGGLAAVAAVGVGDWPVAALIGVGAWVAEQYAKAARQPDGAEREVS